MCWTRFKNFWHSSKISAPLRKLFAPAGNGPDGHITAGKRDLTEKILNKRAKLGEINWNIYGTKNFRWAVIAVLYLIFPIRQACCGTCLHFCNASQRSNVPMRIPRALPGFGSCGFYEKKGYHSFTAWGPKLQIGARHMSS